MLWVQVEAGTAWEPLQGTPRRREVKGRGPGPVSGEALPTTRSLFRAHTEQGAEHSKEQTEEAQPVVSGNPYFALKVTRLEAGGGEAASEDSALRKDAFSPGTSSSSCPWRRLHVLAVFVLSAFSRLCSQERCAVHIYTTFLLTAVGHGSLWISPLFSLPFPCSAFPPLALFLTPISAVSRFLRATLARRCSALREEVAGGTSQGWVLWVPNWMSICGAVRCVCLCRVSLSAGRVDTQGHPPGEDGRHLRSNQEPPLCYQGREGGQEANTRGLGQ